MARDAVSVNPVDVPGEFINTNVVVTHLVYQKISSSLSLNTTGRFLNCLSAAYPHLSVSAISKRARRMIEVEAAKPRSYPKSLEVSILIIDGLWYKFKGKNWILYLFLLKQKNGQAFVLDPVMLPGKESYESWDRALSTIPINLKKQIKVVVSDNFRSSVVIARQKHWRHQLCHFHLLSELRRKRGRRKKNISAKALREEIYQTIKAVLFEQSEKRAASLTERLKFLCVHPACPKRLSFTVGEFIRRQSLYRTYLRYPEYQIPTTTNSIESLNKMLRRCTRHLRTPESVLLWATVFVRKKKTITCNGTNQIK